MMDMNVNVLAFGIAKEIVGGSMTVVALQDAASVGALKITLEKQFPGLKNLGTYMIAVNNDYSAEQTVIHPSDELAIIPPVSGG
jgi:molybdopterin converting factor small subunit